MDSRPMSFVGRQPADILQTVGQTDILSAAVAVLDELGMVVLGAGQRGIGRGQLALAIARGGAYDGCVWVEASSSVGLAVGLSQARAALSDRPPSSRWLVVLDGAADPLGVDELRRLGAQVVVIPSGGRWPSEAEVWLGPLEGSEPETLLSQLSGRAPDRALRALSASLGGVPLALSLVGRVLRDLREDAAAIEVRIEGMKRRHGHGREAEEDPGPAPGYGDPLEAWLASHVVVDTVEATRPLVETEVRVAVELALESLGHLREAGRTLLACCALSGGGLRDLAAVPGAPIGAELIDALQSAGLIWRAAEGVKVPAGVCLAVLGQVRAAEQRTLIEGLWARSLPRQVPGPDLLRLAALESLASVARLVGCMSAELAEGLAEGAAELVAAGQPDAAHAWLERLVADLRAGLVVSPGARAGIYDTLSKTQYALGRVDEAQYALEEAMMALEASGQLEDPRLEDIYARRVELLQEMMGALGSSGASR